MPLILSIRHTNHCACIGVRNGNQEIRGSLNTCLGLIGHRNNPKLFHLQSSEIIMWFKFIYHPPRSHLFEAMCTA